MAENLKERLSSLSGKLKMGGAEVSKKVGTSMVSMGDKMKELFKVPTPADKLVEELTSENALLQQEGPDWAKIMELCDSIRNRDMNGQDVVKALKKRLMLRSNASLDPSICARIHLLTLTLIEACVKNCEHLFVDISNEHLLDEMVKIVDEPSTPIVTRDKALKLIEAWGESTPELRNLPMFEETYKSLKSRGVKFPLRDPESLAPIFTPPHSVAPTEKSGVQRRTHREVLMGTQEDLILPQSEEVLQTARNSVDLLSTVLTSSPQQEALQHSHQIWETELEMMGGFKTGNGFYGKEMAISCDTMIWKMRNASGSTQHKKWGNVALHPKSTVFSDSALQRTCCFIFFSIKVIMAMWMGSRLKICSGVCTRDTRVQGKDHSHKKRLFQASHGSV